MIWWLIFGFVWCSKKALIWHGWCGYLFYFKVALWPLKQSLLSGINMLEKHTTKSSSVKGGIWISHTLLSWSLCRIWKRVQLRCPSSDVQTFCSILQRCRQKKVNHRIRPSQHSSIECTAVTLMVLITVYSSHQKRCNYRAAIKYPNAINANCCRCCKKC